MRYNQRYRSPVKTAPDERNTLKRELSMTLDDRGHGIYNWYEPTCTKHRKKPVKTLTITQVVFEQSRLITYTRRYMF